MRFDLCPNYIRQLPRFKGFGSTLTLLSKKATLRQASFENCAGENTMDPDIGALAEEGRAFVRHEIKAQEAFDDIVSKVLECYCFPQNLPED